MSVRFTKRMIAEAYDDACGDNKAFTALINAGPTREDRETVLEWAKDTENFPAFYQWEEELEEEQKKKQSEARNNEARQIVADLSAAFDNPAEFQKGIAALAKLYAPEGTRAEPLTFARLTEHLQAEREGIKTGLASLDQKGILIPRGALTIISARPGRGKTSLMLTLARKLIDSGKAVLFYSYEEAPYRLAAKLGLGYLGSAAPASDAFKEWKHYLAGKDSAIRPDERKPKYAKGKLSDYLNTRFFIREGSANIGALVSDIRDMKRTLEKDGEELAAVFLDYIQLIPSTGDDYSRQTELARISASLRDLARDEELAILSGAQLTRNAKEEDHIREADDILNDANLVLKIDPPDSFDDIAADERLALPYKIKITKNRDGASDIVADIAFRGRCYSFEDENALSDEERTHFDKAKEKAKKEAKDKKQREKNNSPDNKKPINPEEYDWHGKEK